MVSRGVVKGIEINPNDKMHECSCCILGKGYRTAITQKSHSLANIILDLVHSDVLGSLVSSVGGSKYVITFIEDYFNRNVEYTMRHNSEALERFKQYKYYVETHTKVLSKNLHVLEHCASSMTHVLLNPNSTCFVLITVASIFPTISSSNLLKMASSTSPLWNLP